MSTASAMPLLRSLAAAAAVLFGLVSAPADAATHGFSAQQTDAIREIVRDYLVSNPEVILEAIEALKAKDQANSQARARQTLVARRAELFEDPDSPTAGNPRGDVRIIEFFDYRCPYCKKIHPTIQSLLRDDANIKFIYKEWPILGPSSVYAARAALAARKKGKYIELHAALMDIRGSLDESAVLGAAKSVGLNTDEIVREMEAQGPKIQEMLARNDDLARGLGISGTPAFVIGDLVLRGAADLEAMKKAVADVRRRAAR